MASVLANTALSVAGRLIGLAAGLGVTAMLGRVLGVEQFGMYTVVLSFGALLHVLTDGGLYLTLTRELPRQTNHQHILAAITTLRIGLFVAVFIAGAALLYSLPKYSNLLGLYSVAAAGFLFQSLSQLLMGVFQSYKTMWPATLGDITGRLVQVAVVGALAVGFFLPTERSLVIAMAAFAAGAGAAYGIHVRFLPQLQAWRLTYAPQFWRTIIQQSWPLGVMLLLNAIYFRIDLLMLSYMRSEAEVGWYGLAYRVIESGLFLPAAFGGLLLPRLSGLADNQERKKLLEQALFTMLLVGALAFVVLAGSSTPLLVWLVGPQFAPSGPLLSILTAALVIMFFGNVYGFSLVALGKQRSLLYLYAVLALGNTVGNALLIPRFGAAAAAWTTVATEAVSTLVAAIIVSRYIPHRIQGREVLAVIGCAGLAALVLWALLSITHVTVAILGACATYAITAWASRLLNRRRVTLLIAS